MSAATTWERTSSSTTVGSLGHSCLIPIPETKIKAMYVFVDITFDLQHLLGTFLLNFPNKCEQ